MSVKDFSLSLAARALDAGGVIAYPTEGVFGLGCRVDCLPAVRRVIALKRRAPNKGLIVIVAGIEDALPFIHAPERWLPEAVSQGFGEAPVTCVFPVVAGVSALLTGGRASIALRVVQHPLAAELCRRCGPLVSTSANASGAPAARTGLEVRLRFGSRLDWIVNRPVGGLGRPTALYDVEKQRRLR